MQVTRRSFMVRSAAVAAGFAGLQTLFAQSSRAGLRGLLDERALPDIGPLVVDPARLVDLPDGFRYTVFARAGETMDDGLRVPGRHDGMAAFPLDDARCILVCNHEIEPAWVKESAFGEDNSLLNKVAAERLYDAGFGKSPGLGGTSTRIFNTRTQTLERQWLSLAGTNRNCAGGPTPWGSWLSCEEDVTSASATQEKDHGFVFEVPAADAPALCDPTPITAMGRFNHEAVCLDPATGIVYLTEDQPDGLLYRFVPTDRGGGMGSLHKGGRLQALALVDRSSADTRNWPPDPLRKAPPAPRIAAGAKLAVRWVDLEDITPVKDDLRHRGASVHGAAVFARGEGCWFGQMTGQPRGAVYFACTNGGQVFKGQIWRYTPSPAEGTPEEGANPGMLELFIEPNDGNVLDNCDNITVAPWGDLVVCEDGDGEQFLVGVTPQGRCYKIARNSGGKSEWSGACFSPDGTTLFANLQKPGLCLAITGPWPRRPA